MEGIIDIQPVINKIEFPQNEKKMSVCLKDGRIIVVPLKYFPGIEKLNAQQRKKWQIINDVGFTFENCREVYHIEEILGNYDDYKYEF